MGKHKNKNFARYATFYFYAKNLIATFCDINFFEISLYHQDSEFFLNFFYQTRTSVHKNEFEIKGMYVIYSGECQRKN